MSHFPAFSFRHSWFIALLGLGACAHQDTRQVAPAPEQGNDKLMVYTLPVGAGNCQLLQCPSQDRVIVFDCGSTGVGDKGWSAEAVKVFVDKLLGPKTEVNVALSHSDSDHGNYLPTVFPDRPIGSIYLGGNPTAYVTAVKNWIADKKMEGTTVVSSWPKFYQSDAPEDALSCWVPDGKNGFKVDVAGYILGVNAGSSPNAYSMVVGSVYGDFQMLFTGDMTGETEAAIGTGGPYDLSNTNVITGAHHGADTAGSNSQSWATANSPRTVIFSAGDKHKHPRCASVDRYLGYLHADTSHRYHCGESDGYEERTTTRNVFVTDDNGLITVEALNDGNATIEWQDSDSARSTAIKQPRAAGGPVVPDTVLSRGKPVDAEN